LYHKIVAYEDPVHHGKFGVKTALGKHPATESDIPTPKYPIKNKWDYHEVKPGNNVGHVDSNPANAMMGKNFYPVTGFA
jgi:hypothetical protein